MHKQVEFDQYIMTQFEGECANTLIQFYCNAFSECMKVQFDSVVSSLAVGSKVVCLNQPLCIMQG